MSLFDGHQDELQRVEVQVLKRKFVREAVKRRPITPRTMLAARRWGEKRVKSIAAGAGLIMHRPDLVLWYRPDRLCEELHVRVEYGLVLGSMDGEVLIMPDGAREATFRYG